MISVTSLLLTGIGIAQTANASLSLTSLVTGQLNTPAPPTVTPHGTTGTSPWAYAVAALDEAGGSTSATAPVSISNGNLNLNASNYNIISTYVVSGAANCVIYRTTVPTGQSLTDGIIGTIACGTSLNDTGLTATTAVVPTGNSTGSINLTGNLQTVNLKASGTATAGNFVAQGSNAGGDTYVAGTAITSVQPDSVTIEAPGSVTGGTLASYAMILPTAAPPTNNGVMLFTQGSGSSFYTSTATFGQLTDSTLRSPTVIPTTTSSSFNTGDIVTINCSAPLQTRHMGPCLK